MISSNSPMVRLRQGNKRFVEGKPYDRIANLSRHTSGQAPFAVVLSCSDSRVPPEIIFDAGLGDLFVIRVAGNLAGPSQIGSIDYAVSHLGCSLVVVLGHSNCGAVSAAVAPKSDAEKPSAELGELVEQIRSAIDVSAVAEEDRVERAVRQNIDTAVRQLRAHPLLHEAAALGKLKVVGAEYSLETGLVEFFE